MDSVSSIVRSPAEKEDDDEPGVADVTFQGRAEQPGAIPSIGPCYRENSDCLESINVMTEDGDLEAQIIVLQDATMTSHHTKGQERSALTSAVESQPPDAITIGLLGGRHHHHQSNSNHSELETDEDQHHQDELNHRTSIRLAAIRTNKGGHICSSSTVDNCESVPLTSRHQSSRPAARPGAFPVGPDGQPRLPGDSTDFSESVTVSEEWVMTTMMAPMTTINATVMKSSSAPVVSADIVDEERERQRDEAEAALNVFTSSITVHAELVDDVLPVQDNDNKHHHSKRSIAAACLLLVVVVVSMTVLIIRFATDGRNGNNNESANNDNPLMKTQGHRCFQSSNELQAAASQFLLPSVSTDNNNDEVMEKYGATIGSWCVSQVTSFQHLFDVSLFPVNASFFNEPISLWDTSRVTDMSFMFSGATSYNQSIELWDVSSVTDLAGMFGGAASYNQPMSLWDTSSVTGMSQMFNGAGSYNQPMSSWNTSSVTTIGVMFQDAISYNQPISDWNTSQVTVMYGMFWNARSYNQPMSLWDTSQVTSMRNMFEGATSYNQPMSLWNTSQVTNMYCMFRNATSYNQPMALWDASQVTSMRNMFDGATSYNQPMSSWSTSSVKDLSFAFHGAESFNQELNAWDVSNVTSMKEMFAGAMSFDQDLSGWNVAKASDFSSMFEGASRFNQNLCSWGKLLPPNANVKSMFASTSCITVDDPNLTADPPGPFCHPCI